MTTADLITAECDAIKAMLLDKNARYGDSAMQPRRIFSRADAIEQIKVRIDDKLSRVGTMGTDDADEDTVGDLIGYLVLLRIARRRARQWEEVDDMIEPWEAAIPEQDVQRREQAAHGAGYVLQQVDDSDDGPPVRMPPETVLPLKPLPDECLGALCGRVRG